MEFYTDTLKTDDKLCVKIQFNWGDQDVDGRIKMDLQEVGGGRGDWLELAQDRDRWRALVGTVSDFRVS